MVLPSYLQTEKSEEKDFIFYGNTTHPSGAVEYAGDNRTGEGDGDDESITVNLNKLPESIDKITFVVTIFEAEKRLQNFGMVEHAYIRGVNKKQMKKCLDLTYPKIFQQKQE